MGRGLTPKRSRFDLKAVYWMALQMLVLRMFVRAGKQNELDNASRFAAPLAFESLISGRQAFAISLLSVASATAGPPFTSFPAAINDGPEIILP